MRLSRTTGAGAGALVLLLGLWVGLIPFVGPYFHYGFGPDTSWHFTVDRLWLVILPAAAAVIGGLMMMVSVTRAGGVLGSWLGLVGGVWLLIGPSMSLLWGHTAPGVLQSGVGTPLGAHYRAAAEMIGVFYGAGALITMLSAFALGRFALAEPLATSPAGATAAERRAAERRGYAREPRTATEPGASYEPGVAGEPPAAEQAEAAEEAPPRRGLIRRRPRGAAPAERGEDVRRV